MAVLKLHRARGSGDDAEVRHGKLAPLIAEGSPNWGAALVATDNQDFCFGLSSAVLQGSHPLFGGVLNRLTASPVFWLTCNTGWYYNLVWVTRAQHAGG